MLERVKGKIGKMALYTFVYFLLVGLCETGLGFIPVVGESLQSIFTTWTILGLTFTVVNLYNGDDSKESPVSFFVHAAQNFKMWIFTSLWIFVKCLPGIITFFVGIILMGVGGVGFTAANMESELSSLEAGMGILALSGMLIMFIGLIIWIIIGLKYSSINYEIIYNKDPNKKAKTLVEETRIHLKGHVWQWLCMLIYYSLYLGVVIFLLSFLLVGAGAIAGDSTIAAIISVVVVYLLMFVAVLFILPKEICSFKELMDDLLAGQGNVPPQFDTQNEPASYEQAPMDNNPQM
jgi:hypothetical protein